MTDIHKGLAGVVADEQGGVGGDADFLAGQQDHFRVGLAAADVIRADQHRRALGQAKLLHDRFGVAQWLVGGHAPDQLGVLDVGQQ